MFVDSSFKKVNEKFKKTTSSVANPLKGFGEHINPGNYTQFKQVQKISKIGMKLFCFGVAGGIIVVGSSWISITVVPAALIMNLAYISGGSIAGGGMLALCSSFLLKDLRCTSCGIMNKINNKIYNPPTALGKNNKCDLFACEDNTVAYKWKKKLIESAEHNIVLSGNYCGGESFDQILELIKEQLKAKPSLKVVVISSDHFITKNNRKLINELIKTYPDRFELEETPVIWHRNPGWKKSTNHSKILSIDYGRYFILGGSGVEDKYAFAKGLGDRNPGISKEQQTGWLDFILPRGFRDQDFVFSSTDTNGTGRRVYIESLKLALRWKGINSAKRVEDMDSVVNSLIRDEMNKDKVTTRKVTTEIPEFGVQSDLSEGAKTKIYCTGPEHATSPFEAEIVNRFENAQNQITIDHMYFHPSSKVMTALINAANRGVKVKIVTNGFAGNKKSPKGHAVFAPRNRYNYQYFVCRVKDEYKDNIEVYEFIVEKTTLHKKVIVVDDYVIGGSSNFGYKSLETMSDHEINFVTKSEKLARQVLGLVSIDSKTVKESSDITVHATRIMNPGKKLSRKTLFKAFWYRVNAPIIG